MRLPLLLLTSFASTQTTATQTATTITGADLARHIEVIAHDSMQGRETPSPGLEKTAQYVADQFHKLGLEPFGDRGTWFHRYPIPLPLRLAQSRLVFTTTTSGNQKTAAIDFAAAVHMPVPHMPPQHDSASVILVAGHDLAALLDDSGMHFKIILYAPWLGIDSAAKHAVIDQLRREGKGVIVLSEAGSATPEGRGHDGDDPFVVARFPNRHHRPGWVVHVRTDAIESLRDVLAAAGVDLVQVRTDTTGIVRKLPLKVLIAPAFDTTGSSSTIAPNVVGILRGSAPSPKEYVVFSAHMDHIGISHGRPDSVNNGANDNAAGTAGLIELAEAFSQRGAQPRRSVIFVATSGGAKDKSLWGSTQFAEHQQEVERGLVAANISLDMIGRGGKDSVTVDGLQDIEFTVSPAWIAASHPELRLTLVDGGTAFHPGSDQFAFARKAIPSLLFYNDTHREKRLDENQLTDSAATIDTDQVARILRLVFYIGQESVDTAERPWLNAEGRARWAQAVLGKTAE